MSSAEPAVPEVNNRLPAFKLKSQNLRSNNKNTALIAKADGSLEQMDKSAAVKKTAKHQRKCKSKKSKFRIEHGINTKKMKNEPTTEILDSAGERVAKPPAINLPPHQRLRQYRDAQQILHKLDLLQTLYSERIGPDDAEATFAQFTDLRRIWDIVLIENSPEYRRKRDISEQWRQVFFGNNAMPKMENLIHKRRIWDSYLTHGMLCGSSIPSGWVLPKEQSDKRWLAHRKS